MEPITELEIRNFKRECIEKHEKCRIIRKPKSSPMEIVAEVESYHRDYAVTYALIRKSEPHRHNKVTKVIRVKRGVLLLYIVRKNVTDKNQSPVQKVKLEPNDFFIVPAGYTHWVESLSRAPAEIVVVSTSR